MDSAVAPVSADQKEFSVSTHIFHFTDSALAEPKTDIDTSVMSPPRFNSAAAITAASLSGAVFGWNLGVMSGLTRVVTRFYYPNADVQEQSLMQGVIASALLVGAFIGSVLGVRIAASLGRRTALLTLGAVCSTFGILQSVLFKAFTMFIIARTMLGISVGMAGSVAPLYVSEISPPHMSNRLGNVFQVAICTAILVGMSINYFWNPEATTWMWRLQLATGALPGIALTAVCVFKRIPETLRITSEHGHVHSYVQESIWSIAGLPHAATALTLASAVQLSGINALMNYAPQIFEKTHIGNVLVMNLLICGLWSLLASCVSIFLVQIVSKKSLLMSGLAVMSGALLVVGLSYAYNLSPMLQVFAIIIFNGAFQNSAGPLFFPLAAESFPPQFRDAGLSLANSSNWTLNILVVFFFPLAVNVAGDANVFCFFSLIALGCVCALKFLLPDSRTKGIVTEKYTAMNNSGLFDGRE